MTTIKGPAIFLAQFLGDQPPFNEMRSICKWAASLGFKGVQIPTWDPRCIDLQKAAESKTYADELKGLVNECGLEITELSTHLQGQLVAVNPAYDKMFDGFAPEAYRNNAKARTAWAVQQLEYAAKASANLGLDAHATFSGSLLWHTIYPWPQRPAGLVEDGFKELAKRWLPILNKFDESGVDLCYEIHPGEDLHDGVTYEMFLDKVNSHQRPACYMIHPILYCNVSIILLTSTTIMNALRCFT
jgi:sugar phosphate isomerase/epimerase